MTARLLRKKKKYWPIGFVVLILALIVPIVSFAATSPTINQWPTSVGFSGPNSIVTGPDGYLWFAQSESNQIGKINPGTGAITEYNLPAGPPETYSQTPDGITVGPDGNLWFGVISPVSGPDEIGRMTPTGSLTEFSLNGSMLLPGSLVTGPDGNIWVAAFSGGTIGVVNTSGTLLRTYAAPGGPEGLSVGPDGNIWMVLQDDNQVAKINPSTGAITRYAVPYLPLDTAPGPDGDVWFTGGYGSYVGKINPSTGAITTYNIPVPAVSPYYGAINLTAGPDGNMWATLEGYGLAMINPSTGAVTEYETHSFGSGPTAEAVTSGPDGNIWFTASDNNASIGDLVLRPASSNTAPAVTSASSASVVAGSQLKFTVTTTGNPAPNISESGSLPGGVSFKDNGNGTGTLSGLVALSAHGDYKLTLTATNSVGNVSQNFVLNVETPPNTGSGSSSGSGNDCPNSTSAEHSASGCSANAPGQVGKNDNASASTANSSSSSLSAANLTTPSQSKIVVQNTGNNQTEAIVAPGLNLSSISYTVPKDQVLYNDGTLGEVTAASGSTVKGSGKIAGSLTVDKGAKLAPGHSPGCLTNGGLTLFGSYQVQIGGTSACSQYDQVTVDGKALLAGTMSVNSVNGYVPDPGQNFTVMQLARGTLSGTFLGLPNAAIYSSEGIDYRVNYTGTNVVLHVTSVDSDIARSSAAAVSTKLVNDVVPQLVSRAIVELAILCTASFVLLMAVVYFEARLQE